MLANGFAHCHQKIYIQSVEYSMRLFINDVTLFHRIFDTPVTQTNKALQSIKPPKKLRLNLVDPRPIERNIGKSFSFPSRSHHVFAATTIRGGIKPVSLYRSLNMLSDFYFFSRNATFDVTYIVWFRHYFFRLTQPTWTPIFNKRHPFYLTWHEQAR